MTPRRLALASIAVVTVLCLVGVSILAVASGGRALAYEVNGTRTSQQSFDNLLDDIVKSDANQASAQNVSQTKGSVGSTVAASVMTTSILRAILRDEVDRRGVEVGAADREAGNQAAASQLGANERKVPASYRNLIVDTYAYANALGLTGTDKLSAFITKKLRNTDVYVNPRYGFWNPRYGVCPPTGCNPSGTGG